MSAPPGRSATVTSLSGRVSALKFMQRASPSTSSTPTKSTASSSRTPLGSPSPAASSPAPCIPGSPAFGAAAAEEEQWSLSPAAIARLRAKATGSNRGNKTKATDVPTISQEAGFDAWLITREKEQPSEATNPGRTSQRQTFGKLGKQKQGQDDEREEQDSKKRSRGQQDDEDDQTLEPDFDESEKEEEPKGFVKPGSLSAKSTHNKKSNNQQQDSRSQKKHKKHDRGKDQDKVVFARKRGGKPGISGGGR